MEEGESIEERKSKYSSGVNILMRLDKLWMDCHNHSRAGLYYNWDTDLDRIWVELARDISDKDYDEKKEAFDKLSDDLKKISLKIVDDVGKEYGFEDIPPEIQENRSKQYTTLMEKELFLKRLENELGKGTTWDDGDGDDFD